ncbi:MAG: Tad domain-containing protein [Bdellovibrionales bacterium]|nr:Tad domain-containing protein [Bdellovibrionales bacterium]
MKNDLMKGKRGQLIVFGVLVFPVIFFFLAMVINVGMVVHDKINLQNSVDLAAIYAAQKQAEVMDAMAHINYQMRQSYKLFAWRYLVLGNSGGFVEPTIPGVSGSAGGGRFVMNILNKSSVTDRSLCPHAGSGCLNAECDLADTARRWKCPYAVCTIHPLFHTQWYNDNTHICQNYKLASSARSLPPVTPTTGILPTLSVLAGNERVRSLRKQLSKNCSDVGYQNWLVATSMYLSFLKDQRERKLFIDNRLFPLLQNGQDIDNKPIGEGVRNTIWKNLTYVNYRGFNSPDPPDPKLRFTIVQSQAGGVDPRPIGSSTSFNTFFQWDEIAPIPSYVQNTDNHRNAFDSSSLTDGDTNFCVTTVQSIFQCDPSDSNLHFKPNSEVMTATMNRIVTYQPDYEPITWCEILKSIWRNPQERVLGFYKKQSPKAHLGVRVEVEIPYKGQLFFPFFTPPGIVPMTLKAVAYAKPFGASFGPSDPKTQDPRIPRAGPEFFMLFPNYSRSPGDPLGLTDERVQWAWNFLFTEGRKSIHGSSSNIMRTTSKAQGRTFNNYSDLPNNMDYYRDAVVLQHDHVPDPTASTVVVNLNHNEIFNKTMRVYEEMAIAPDQFDRTYYTILPNYMVTLYPRLKKAFGPDYVPADLGHFRNENTTNIPPSAVYTNSPALRGHDPPFRLNYIERQIIYAQEQPRVSPASSHGISSVFNSYKLNSINQLLTSWTPDLSDFYVHSQDMYDNRPPRPPPPLNCELDDKDVKLTFNGSDDPYLGPNLERKMIPSHCLKGERTGFSVKLIHPSALRE